MRKLRLICGLAPLFLLGCSQESQHGSGVTSASDCDVSTTTVDGELHLARTSNFDQMDAKAELVLGTKRIAISNLLAATLHQLMLTDGSARTNLSIAGECNTVHIKRGSLVDIYRGYSAYDPSTIASARNLQINLKSGKLNDVEVGKQLFDLYLANPTSGEQQSLEILTKNGISTEDLRAEFVKTVSRDMTWAFASSWDRLTHGLLISNAMNIRYMLPEPSKCEMDFNDLQSSAERLEKHGKCFDDRNVLRGRYMDGSHDFAIKSQTTITVRKSLDGKTVTGGDIQAELISLSDISDSTLEQIKRHGALAVNY